MTKAKDREPTPAEMAAAQDPDALLPVWVVAKLVGTAPNTINIWEAKGLFPRAIHLNPKIKRYRAGTVREWLRTRAGDHAASSSGAEAS